MWSTLVKILIKTNSWLHYIENINSAVRHYTDVARLWVRHSDMLSRGWNVNKRPKAECDIPTEGQHSLSECRTNNRATSVLSYDQRSISSSVTEAKRESLSSVIYDINAHTSSYRLRLSVSLRVNWSDTARQMLYTRPAVTWIRVELRTWPNSNPNPNPNRVHSQILNDKRPAVCIDTLIQQTYLKIALCNTLIYYLIKNTGSDDI